LHTVDTRQRQNLHLPQANLTIHQKGAYYAGIKIYNKLPIGIKNASNNLKMFKIELRHCLNTHFILWMSTLMDNYYNILYSVFCFVLDVII
jgi:hypothetical protein